MTHGKYFKPSDLPIREGKAYHLDLKPDEIAQKIIIVGDPGRVPIIADEFLGSREVDRFHRGFRSITGHVKETGMRVSIITSGIGTPSIEVILNEIIALNEIDFKTMKRKSERNMITLIRVGTSGAIQQDTELGTCIITEYVVGLDNTGLFYDAPCFDDNLRILEGKIREAVDGSIPRNSRFKGKIFPYAARVNEDVVRALEKEAQRLEIRYKRGITITNSGFFGNQGRDISRVQLTVPEIDGVLASLDTGIGELRIENMEMEASFLVYFMAALGYRAGVICPVIDNRREGTFLTEFESHIRIAARVAVDALSALP